jgi:hypothetical protein
MLCSVNEAEHSSRRKSLFADQKLNLACKSMRRFAAEFEKGPDCSALGWSNNREPKMPLGLAKFTLLKTFLALTPKVRL